MCKGRIKNIVVVICNLGWDMLGVGYFWFFVIDVFFNRIEEFYDIWRLKLEGF